MHRRKNSKSPLYIRNKVKELEEQMHRTHKQKGTTTLQNRVQHQQPHVSKPNNLTQTHRNQHMVTRHTDRKPLRVGTP